MGPVELDVAGVDLGERERFGVSKDAIPGEEVDGQGKGPADGIAQVPDGKDNGSRVVPVLDRVLVKARGGWGETVGEEDGHGDSSWNEESEVEDQRVFSDGDGLGLWIPCGLVQRVGDRWVLGLGIRHCRGGWMDGKKGETKRSSSERVIERTSDRGIECSPRGRPCDCLPLHVRCHCHSHSHGHGHGHGHPSIRQCTPRRRPHP